MSNRNAFLLLFCVLILPLKNADALGPVDGEIGIGWWANDFEADISEAELDAGSTFIYGEGWLGDHWGIRGAWYDSDLEGEEFSDQTRFNLELRRKFFSVTDNNFVALGAGIEIDHACGGVCACSTCHVQVDGGLETCNEANDAEEDQLDLAPGLTETSRLACQCVPDGSAPLRVVIPAWNRNLVSEGH